MSQWKIPRYPASLVIRLNKESEFSIVGMMMTADRLAFSGRFAVCEVRASSLLW
jgi:hypothetical protein